MATDRYIAALEISSSKVIGAVGAIGKSGQLEILAIGQEKSTDSIRYGQIQNIEETSNLITLVLERLARRPNISPREITGVYVGISGRSVRSIEKEVSLSLPDDTEITDAILERLKTKALETDIDSSLEIIDAVPRSYTVGRTETSRPKGRIGNSISAVYNLIVGRRFIQSTLRKVLHSRLGLEIRGTVVTPLAVGEIVLNEHERNLGCMLVDMGAETTSVVIYKHGTPVYYATLPMGGRNITLDLKALNVLEDKAEELKVTFGNAIAPAVPSQETIGGIKLSKISNYVVARAEEIVANIAEQIRYAGLTEKDLPEGIIVCGGGSRLNGMLDLIGKFTGLKARMATYPSYICMSDPAGQGMESLEISAIMHEGSKMMIEDCLQLPPEPEPEPQEQEQTELPEERKKREKKPSFMERLGGKFVSFFTPIGEDDEGDELS